MSKWIELDKHRFKSVLRNPLVENIRLTSKRPSDLPLRTKAGVPIHLHYQTPVEFSKDTFDTSTITDNHRSLKIEALFVEPETSVKIGKAPDQPNKVVKDAPAEEAEPEPEAEVEAPEEDSGEEGGGSKTEASKKSRRRRNTSKK